MINLYSDTQSLPSPSMRLAMSQAEVGDEQKGTDPTVSKLIATVAGLLGKETGIFLPSGWATTLCGVRQRQLHQCME
jgi:threonine aldolase